MAVRIQKENDYMISTSQSLQSDATLTRTFNFASETVTTLYERIYRYGEGVALESKMDSKNFSELDSQGEVEMLRAELKKQGGTPPETSQGSTGKARIKAATSP